MTEPGTLPGDAFSVPFGLNNKGQVVGQSCDASGNCRAFIWQNGSMSDLNLLVPPRSHLYLTYGGDINDSGWIVGYGYDMKSGAAPRSWRFQAAKRNRRVMASPQPRSHCLKTCGGAVLQRSMLQPMPE